jgi:hypothetical protein
MTKKVDLFPAIVIISPPDSLEDYASLQMSGHRPQGTRVVDRSRVAIVNGKMYIAVDSPEGPNLVFREMILDYSKSEDGKTHHALTETGKIIAFGKDHNCGCGSRLRSWSPFGNYLSATGDPDA